MNLLTSVLAALGSCIVILTARFFTATTTMHTSEDKTYAQEQETLLLIGIMSSRSNIKARESIRKTWVQETSQDQHFFLIGEEFCPIPMIDRISEYACQEWMITVPNALTTSTEFVLSKITENFSKVLDPELRMLVHHSIVIRRLCILSDLIKNQTRGILFNLATGEIVISATFTNQARLNNSLICKTVELFNFPKGFEGKMVIDSSHPARYKCNLAVADSSQLITYRSSNKQRTSQEICSPLSLIYTIHDVQALEEHIRGRERRKESWIIQQKNIDSLLIQEQQKFNDILFLPVVDVYRNLSLKVLEFFKWSDKNLKFKYLLKTDDDTFIDIHRVRTKLDSLKSNSWWSSFRENWPVQQSGKWREDEYTSVTYPPFPCGAGYVLSADLVHFLASNANRLYCYQGEDVSLGIWLAPLNPTRLNYCWECSDCDPHACNIPQLTVQQMYNSWNLYKNNTNFCSALQE